ncbi:MAG: septal ring lytic transglycosylase RlpA family protein [Deltaproteobacteria bacterium]|jgi:rare lipoprotein A|nr:septal ring lytic transglycosylase RlpA family protein [Deltaproteobacteria bacterium]
MNLRYLLITAALSLSIASCAPYHAGRRPLHYVVTGKASWYGPGFAGRKTANGERFNPNAMTAAHKTLPMNTTVRVTNIKNGKTVVVRINDRGPFIRGRIIDLSKAAAKKIDMIGHGTSTVKLEALTTPGSIPELAELDGPEKDSQSSGKNKQKKKPKADLDEIFEEADKPYF